MSKPPLSNENQIEMYLHCGKCIDEWIRGGSVSPAREARLAVGWTKRGLQVWCERHHCNVVNIDFEGCQHPANTTRKTVP